MDIRIIMLDGTSRNINVNININEPEDSVASLKIAIEKSLGFPAGNQNLAVINDGRIPLRDDNQSLRDYGVQSGSQVSLLVSQPATKPESSDIQVFFRNEKGQTSTYDITPEETVADFKTRVQHREGVPVSQQRLIHQGREMNSGSLADYSVRALLSTIYMTLRLRGR